MNKARFLVLGSASPTLIRGVSESLGTSEHTARRYLDILAGAYMVRVLPPWFENLGKRQVKAPKIYIRDSGILHAILHPTGD